MTKFIYFDWCGSTHHAGCACHEKRRKDEIEALEAENKTLKERLAEATKIITLVDFCPHPGAEEGFGKGLYRYWCGGGHYVYKEDLNLADRAREFLTTEKTWNKNQA